MNMKIKDIRTHVIQHTLDKPFGMSQWLWDTRKICLVEVITDDGVVGWGECYGPAFSNAAVIQELYKPHLMGRDPLSRSVLWEKMYNTSRDYGRKGIAVCALSGIDIALWDIFGKVVRQPIYKLLGGPFTSSIEGYASAFYYAGEYGDNVELEAEQVKQRGYHHVKMKVGAVRLEQDAERVRKVRRVLGSDAQIAVDANHAYTASEAIQFGRAIENERPAWFEEPVEPEDVYGYQKVRETLDIPIAGGESEYTRFGYRDFLQQRCVDIIQPDATACGGITESMHIAYMGHAQGVSVYPHVWGTAIGLAAAMHIIVSIPDTAPSQHSQRPLLELDQAPNLFRDRLSNLQIGPTMQVPNGYGLGIELDESMISHYETHL